MDNTPRHHLDAPLQKAFKLLATLPQDAVFLTLLQRLQTLPSPTGKHRFQKR